MKKRAKGGRTKEKNKEGETMLLVALSLLATNHSRPSYLSTFLPTFLPSNLLSYTPTTHNTHIAAPRHPHITHDAITPEIPHTTHRTPHTTHHTPHTAHHTETTCTYTDTYTDTDTAPTPTPTTTPHLPQEFPDPLLFPGCRCRSQHPHYHLC